jgi:uncharacterized protein with HEPN domain
MEESEYQDAIILNLIIIGEAIKNIPDEVRKKAPEIQRKKIGGLTDIIVHSYFNLDPEILWDIVQKQVLPLKNAIEKIKQS